MLLCNKFISRIYYIYFEEDDAEFASVPDQVRAYFYRSGSNLVVVDVSPLCIELLLVVVYVH